jgi:hypothetical protein
MTHRARVWTAGVIVLCVSSVAVNPVFAQTQPPPAAAAPPPPGAHPPPPAGQPGYAPPPAQPGYPPAPAGQPGYPPPAAGHHDYPAPYPPQGQYQPAPYPYGSPYPQAQVQTAPPGPPQLVHRTRKGLLLAAIITFGASWGLAVLGSALLKETSNPAADVLWVPIAGPILAQTADPSDESLWPMIVMWSLAQAAGPAMAVIGLIGHDVLVDSRGRRVSSNWQLLPTATAHTQGLVLRATF